MSTITTKQRVAQVARSNGWQRLNPKRQTVSEYRRGASWLTVYYSSSGGIMLAEYSRSGDGRATITGRDRLGQVLEELQHA
jgi:hypothetical protein